MRMGGRKGVGGFVLEVLFLLDRCRICLGYPPSAGVCISQGRHDGVWGVIMTVIVFDFLS